MELEYDVSVQKGRKDSNFRIFVFYSSDESEENDCQNLKGFKNVSLEAFYERVLSNQSRFQNPFQDPCNLCCQTLIAFNYAFMRG